MNKKYFTLFIFCFSALISVAQTYQKGYRSITFIDPSRANRSVPTDFYYPADVAGTNVPLASGTNTFPLVVFGHGFSLPTSAYSKLADSLTKYGFLVAFPSTEGSLSPSHSNFGADIRFLCPTIIALNNDPASFLHQRVTPKAAVGGHSMGGGCSFLAAAANTPEIKALFNVAAAETTPSAITAASSVIVPTLQFSGSNDCIVPPATQLSMFNNVLASCKTYVNITGATHCQIADNNFTCTFGQITSGCNSSPITVSVVYTKVVSLLIPFLDYYLKDSCYRGIDFINTYNAMTGVTKLTTCIAPLCSVLPIEIGQFSGNYNGRSVVLNWSSSNEINIKKYMIERSADGSGFSDMTMVNAIAQNGQGNVYSTKDPLPFPDISYYRIKIIYIDGSFAYSKIISIRTTAKAIALTSCYPNPTSGIVHFKIVTEQYRRINISILGVDGKLLWHNTIKIQPGIRDREIDISSLLPGIYLLQLFDEWNKPAGYTKLIKK